MSDKIRDYDEAAEAQGNYVYQSKLLFPLSLRDFDCFGTTGQPFGEYYPAAESNFASFVLVDKLARERRLPL